MRPPLVTKGGCPATAALNRFGGTEGSGQIVCRESEAASLGTCQTLPVDIVQDHRGLPIYPPSYTVIELATGEDHGAQSSEAEVSMCLAFAKLSRDEVEVIAAKPVLASIATRE